MSRVLLGVGLVFAVSCTSDNPCPSSAPNLVRRCLRGVPDFAAYRAGAGPWQTITETQGMYELCVTSDYEMVFVQLQADGSVYASESASTFDETSSDTTCQEWDTTTTRVMVSGQLAQPAEVSMDSQGVGFSTASEFSFSVYPGTHDFVATNADFNGGTPNPTMLVRRRQSVTTNLVEPLVDLAAEGIPMVPVSLSVTGTAAGETVSTRIGLSTNDNDYSAVSQTSTAVANTVPPSLLEPHDVQWLDISAGSRGASTPFTGSESSFDLLPPLTGITFTDAPSAMWSELPVALYGELELWVLGNANDGSPSIQMVTATRGWIDAHDPTTSLSFDTSAPGYQTAWKVAPSKVFDVEFSLAVNTENASYWTAARK